MKFWKIAAIAVASILALLLLAFSVYLYDNSPPSNSIIISAPFDLNDPPTSMIPLGETIWHPCCGGHSGIDFQWTHKTKILASADGVIKSIRFERSGKETWDVFIRHGRYATLYAELSDYNSSLKVGDFIEKGTFIGYPHSSKDLPDGNANHNQIHWEFGYYSHLKRDPIRLCPMTYFDEESERVIQDAWNKFKTNWPYVNQFPQICSGDYSDKDKKGIF